LALIQESKPDTFLGARPTILLKGERAKLLKNLKAFKTLDYDPSESYDGVEDSENQDDPLAPSPTRRISVDRKSRPQSIARFSMAGFGGQRNERQRVAWASIYDASGATHSLVARTSTMFVRGPHEGGQSLMPRISSQDLDTDDHDESISCDAEVTGVKDSGNEKSSDREYAA
jgi:hypothetical protein